MARCPAANADGVFAPQFGAEERIKRDHALKCAIATSPSCWRRNAVSPVADRGEDFFLALSRESPTALQNACAFADDLVDMALLFGRKRRFEEYGRLPGVIVIPLPVAAL